MTVTINTAARGISALEQEVIQLNRLIKQEVVSMIAAQNKMRMLINQRDAFEHTMSLIMKQGALNGNANDCTNRY